MYTICFLSCTCVCVCDGYYAAARIVFCHRHRRRLTPYTIVTIPTYYYYFVIMHYTIILYYCIIYRMYPCGGGIVTVAVSKYT